MSQFTVGPSPLGVRQPDPNAERAQKEQELRDRTGFYEALGAAWDNEGLVQGVGRILDSNFGNGEVDPDFSIFGAPQAFQDNLFRDIAPENMSAFGTARSATHAMKIRRRVLERQAMDQIVANAGTAGTVATIAAAVADPASLAAGFGIGSLASAAARGTITGAKVVPSLTRLGRIESLANRGLVAGFAAGSVEGGLTELAIASSDPTGDPDDVAIATLIGFGLGGTLGGFAGRLEGGSARRQMRNVMRSKEEARLTAEWHDVMEYVNQEQANLRTSQAVIDNVRRQGEEYDRLKAEIEAGVDAELATGVPIPDATIPSNNLPVFVTTRAGDARDRAEAYAKFLNERRAGGSVDGENPYRVMPVDYPTRSGVYTVVQENRIGANRVADEDMVGFRQAVSTSAAVELDLDTLKKLPTEPRRIADDATELEDVRPQDLMPMEMLQMFDDYVSGEKHQQFLRELGESLGLDDADIATAQYLLDEESFSDIAGRMIRGDQQPVRGVNQAMGAASANEIQYRGDFSILPESVKGVPDLVRRLFRGETTPEQAAIEIGDEEVADAIRQAVQARDVNKLPGDFFIAGRLEARKTKYNAGRFDTAGLFGSAKDPLTRMFGSAAVEDVVGGTGSVQSEPLSRFVQRKTNEEARRLRPVLDDAYKQWARENSVGWAKQQVNMGRKQFMRDVSAAVRRDSGEALGPLSNPHVQRAADAIREQNKRLLEFAQRHGILEDVPVNENYLARLYSHKKLLKAVEDHGEENVVNLFKRAISSEQALDDDLATKVATSMYRTIRNSKTSDLDSLTVLRGGDRQTIRDTLDELQANGELQGVDAADIDRIAEVLSPDPAQTAGQSGTISSRQKRRVQLHETAFDPDTGLSFEDLLENDAEAVQSVYAHQIIGAAGMNEVLYAMSAELGEEIKTVQQLKRRLVKSAQEAGDDTSKLYGTGKGNPQASAFDYVTSWSLGRNRFDNNKYRELATIARLHGMLTRGGTFGIAGLAELGRVAASGGLARAFERMPVFRDFYRAARDGTATQEQIDAFLDLSGTTGEINTFAYIARNDTFEDGVADTATRGRSGEILARVREGGRLASRRLSFVSGQAPIQQTFRNMAGHAYVRRWERLAKRGRGIGKKRLEALGIDQQTADRISGQINEHGMDLDKWTDAQAASDFIASANRFVSNVVQTNDPGQLPKFLSTPTGQTLFQFRSFTFGAYHGMLLRGASIRDADEAAMAMASFFAAGSAYIGQTYVRSLAQPDPEAYREERLAPRRVALAAFQRSGVSSVIPDLVNYAAHPFGGKSPFDFRNSSLPTGVLSNPTFDTINDVLGVSLVGEPAGGLIRSLGDGFHTDDFNSLQRLMPFGNVPLVSEAIQATGGYLFDEPE